MKKILYIVATQYDNMGDLLINKCLIDELAEYGQVYLDTKNVPFEFKKVLLEHENVFELSSITKLSLKGKGISLLPFYRNFKFDYLFKSPGPFGGSITINEKFRALIFYYIFFIMKLKKTKSFLIGNDFNIKSDFDKKIIRNYDKVLAGIFVRSKQNVRELQLCNVSNGHYAPDLCFMMKSKINNDTKTKVALSFRDISPGANAKIKDSVKTFIEYFTKKDISIEIFYQVERDREFNFNLYDEFKTEKVFFRNSVLTWDERSFYKDKSIVLSNRLHVLLLGQTYGCIPLALIFREPVTLKITNIYDSINLSELVTEAVSVTNLDEIYNSTVFWQKKIATVNLKQRHIFNDHLGAIFNDLYV